MAAKKESTMRIIPASYHEPPKIVIPCVDGELVIECEGYSLVSPFEGRVTRYEATR